MTEWGVPEIVPEPDGLDQIFVQPKRAPDRAGDLSDLECVGEPRPIVIPRRCDEDLRFVHQPSERLRMDDPVPVALKLGANCGGRLRSLPRRLVAEGCRGRQPLPFTLFELLPY